MKRSTYKKAQVLGEVDYANHVRVLLPVPQKRGLPKYELCWVQITSGNKIKGSGIIDHEPREAPFKLGARISFATEAMADRPTFQKLQHKKNGLNVLLNDLAVSIKESMTFNPQVQRRA